MRNLKFSGWLENDRTVILQRLRKWKKCTASIDNYSSSIYVLTFAPIHFLTLVFTLGRWAIETRQLAVRMLQIYCIPKITQIFFKRNSKISSLVIKYRTGRDCWGRIYRR